MHDTATVDFSAGTLTNTYVTQNADGEVTLAPTVGSEFSGNTLPDGWTTTLWDGGGSATVGNGVLRVDGALTGTASTYTPGRSLEFVATFENANFQAAGFGVDLNDVNRWAIFGTRNQAVPVTTLYASVNTFTRTVATVARREGVYRRFPSRIGEGIVL